MNTNDNNGKIIFADNLTALMKDNNISRKQLSEDLGIKYTTICEWLKGSMMPRSEALRKVAEYFDTTISELLATQEEQEKFIKAPLLVVLDPSLSFEENLINHNYGYVLANKENQFAVKVYTRSDDTFIKLDVDDTIIFDKIDYKDESQLELGKIYYIRKNNNEGEVVAYSRSEYDHNSTWFIPVMNRNMDPSLTPIKDTPNLEIYGVATAVLKKL